MIVLKYIAGAALVAVTFYSGMFIGLMLFG